MKKRLIQFVKALLVMPLFCLASIIWIPLWLITGIVSFEIWFDYLNSLFE